MSKIWVTGARGLVGSELVKAGCQGAARQDLDITSEKQIADFIEKNKLSRVPSYWLKKDQ